MPRYFNTSLRNLVYRLRKFKAVLDEELTDEILRNESIIIDMVRNQLYEGFDGNSARISPPYAQSTIARKIRKGQPTNRVTLLDTGDYYNSLYVAFDQDGFFVASSNPDLSSILIAKYGAPILRLSDENLTRLLREHIRPSLAEKLKNYIQNG